MVRLGDKAIWIEILGLEDTLGVCWRLGFCCADLGHLAHILQQHFTLSRKIDPFQKFFLLRRAEFFFPSVQSHTGTVYPTLFGYVELRTLVNAG